MNVILIEEYLNAVHDTQWSEKCAISTYTTFMSSDNRLMIHVYYLHRADIKTSIYSIVFSSNNFKIWMGKKERQEKLNSILNT